MCSVLVLFTAFSTHVIFYTRNICDCICSYTFVKLQLPLFQFFCIALLEWFVPKPYADRASDGLPLMFNNWRVAVAVASFLFIVNLFSSLFFKHSRKWEQNSCCLYTTFPGSIPLHIPQQDVLKGQCCVEWMFVTFSHRGIAFDLYYYFHDNLMQLGI